MVQGIVIDAAGRKDLHEVTAVLSDAFAFDPPTRALVGVADDAAAWGRLALLFRATVLSGPLAAGTVDIARAADGAPLGVAVWSAPGARTTAWQRFAQGGTYLRAFGLRRIGVAARYEQDAEKARPTEPHWYLQAIGVGSAARGRGVGAALLGHRLAQVDRDAVPAYLESSTPMAGRLYARHGFVPVRRIASWLGAGPYAMRRPPVAGRG